MGRMEMGAEQHIKLRSEQIMAVDVYLYFNGNCREAAEFYAQVFESEKPRIMAFGDSPSNPDYPLPEEAKNLVMHTEVKIHGSNVMLSDVFPGRSFLAGNNINLVIVTKKMDEIKSLFNSLKEGGTVEMDLQETFWSKCYGSLIDKFGIGWQFSYDNGEMRM